MTSAATPATVSMPANAPVFRAWTRVRLSLRGVAADLLRQVDALLESGDARIAPATVAHAPYEIVLSVRGPLLRVLDGGKGSHR